ncbi:MAG: enoyl-CoA hydratase [Pseudomonadota bacterium]
MTVSIDPNVIYSQNGPVFTLQMHRPEKKNALTQTMYRALAEGLLHADADDSIKVTVIHGTADCFTSGNDVSDFVVSTERNSERPSVQFMKAISHARKPVIAAVNGLAIGIGTTMLLHCDLVYASSDAFLQLPFTRLGLCPEAGSSFLAPLLMGHQRAAELLLLGERFSASAAKEYGLVNAVLPDGEVLAYAMQKAHELGALPGDAVQTTKHLLKRAQHGHVDETITRELEQFSRLLQSSEAQAIMQAFLNRKKS